MDRLTAIQVFKEQLDYNEENGIYGDLADAYLMAYVALNEIQSVYDTGLTPERCAALAKAEQEGRLVELPCKVRDVVYAVSEKEIIQCKVTEFTIAERGIRFIRMYSTDDRIADFRYKTFMETVFPTREEAEKALESEGE